MDICKICGGVNCQCKNKINKELEQEKAEQTRVQAIKDKYPKS